VSNACGGVKILINIIRKVELDWKFDSYANPQIRLDECGLEVDFPIFLGAEKANTEIISLLKKHGFNYDCSIMDLDRTYNLIYSDLEKQKVENRIELLDSIFNNAGWGVACFKFDIFDYTFYGNEKSVVERFGNVAPFFRNEHGLYEEVNSLSEIVHYIFIGRDFSFVIKTSKKSYGLYIKKFTELNQIGS
jgi:hypothetical protein